MSLERRFNDFNTTKSLVSEIIFYKSVFFNLYVNFLDLVL